MIAFFRPARWDTQYATRAVVLRTVLQKGRNVALERAKPRKGRFREEFGRREAQGGRGAAGRGGKVNLPPLTVVNTRRWVGEFYPPKRPLRDDLLLFPKRNI